MGAGGIINDILGGAVELCVLRLATEEGFTATVKKDIYGNDFIGYGFTPSKGVSKFVAAATMRAQVEETEGLLSPLDWYKALNPVRRSVCLDIAFNEGMHGLLKFHKMITFLSNHDYLSAASECKVEDPKLDKSRYEPLRNLLANGGA